MRRPVGIRVHRGTVESLTVTPYPQGFSMVNATPKFDSLWLNPPEKPWTPREVPADVLLAGRRRRSDLGGHRIHNRHHRPQRTPVEVGRQPFVKHLTG